MPSIQTNAPHKTSEATSPRFSEQGRTRNSVNEMWDRLSQVGTQLQHVILPREIGSGPASVICPARTAVTVDTCSRDERKSSWIHANVIRFLRKPCGPTTDGSIPLLEKKVIAGQSPKTFDQIEKVVTQALDSGNGFVQLVSSNEERARSSHLRASAIEQLLAKHESCLRQDQHLVLAACRTRTGKALPRPESA